MENTWPARERDGPTGYLDKLPTELILIIAECLREKNESLNPLARMCRRYNEILHQHLYRYDFGLHQQVRAAENGPVASFKHGLRAGASLHVAHILSAAAMGGRLDIVDFMLTNVQVTAADVLRSVLPFEPRYTYAVYDLTITIFGTNDPDPNFPSDEALAVFSIDDRVRAVCALGHAAAGGHLDILAVLFTVKGIDVNVRDRSGRTILFAAKNAETVRYLLWKGADLEVVDSMGRTPLLYSLFRMHREAAEALILEGANVSASDYRGRTAIWRASAMLDPGMPRLLELLVERGAKVNDASGVLAPLQIAVQWGTCEAVMFLLEAGADPGTPNDLVLQALRREEYRTAELLASRGATLIVDTLEDYEVWERYVEWVREDVSPPAVSYYN